MLSATSLRTVQSVHLLHGPPLFLPQATIEATESDYLPRLSVPRAKLDFPTPSRIFRQYALLEKEAWRTLELSPVSLTINHSSKLTAADKAFSAVALSPDSKLLAAGTQSGVIVVWKMEEYPPSIVRTLLPMRDSGVGLKVTEIAWGLQCTQLAVTYMSGSVVVWDISFEMNSQKSLTGTRQLLLLPSDYHRPGYANKKKKGSNSEGEDMPSSEEKLALFPKKLLFHRSFNIGLKHPSIIVGLSGGSLVKWNMIDASTDNPSMVFGSLPPLASEPTLPARTKTRMSVYRETLNFHDQSATKGRGRGSAGTKYAVTDDDHTTREFFQYHRHPVVHIFHIGSSCNLVSIDAAGYVCVWPYQTDSFSAYGWFVPSHTYLLDLTVEVFVTDAKGAFTAGKIMYDGLACDEIEYEEQQELEDDLVKGYDGLASKTQYLLKTRASQYWSSKTCSKLIAKMDTSSRRCSKISQDGRVVVVSCFVKKPVDQNSDQGTDRSRSPGDVDADAQTPYGLHVFKYLRLPTASYGKVEVEEIPPFGPSPLFVLVKHRLRPFDRQSVKGSLKDAKMTSDSMDLVLLLRFPSGYAQTHFDTCRPQDLPRAGPDIGYTGCVTQPLDNKQGARDTSQDGGEMCRIHMVQIASFLSTGPSDSRRFTEQETALLMTPYCVTVPIDTKHGSHPISMGVTKVKDACLSDYVHVHVNKSICTFSLTTAQLVHKLDAVRLVGAGPRDLVRLLPIIRPHSASVSGSHDRTVVGSVRSMAIVMFVDQGGDSGTALMLLMPRQEVGTTAEANRNTDMNAFTCHADVCSRWSRVPEELRDRANERRMYLGMIGGDKEEPEDLGQQEQEEEETEEEKEKEEKLKEEKNDEEKQEEEEKEGEEEPQKKKSKKEIEREEKARKEKEQKEKEERERQERERQARAIREAGRPNEFGLVQRYAQSLVYRMVWDAIGANSTIDGGTSQTISERKGGRRGRKRKKRKKKVGEKGQVDQGNDLGVS